MTKDEGLSADEELFLREALGSSTAARPAAASADERVQQLQVASGRTTRLRRLFKRPTQDERNWKRGAEGERIAAHALSQLPTGWWVLHDLQVGSRGANIDHVVIGPSGVFTINTKHLSRSVWVADGAFMVGGTKTDYLWKARAEGERVGRLLTAAVDHPIDARPVIAVLAPQLTIKSSPRDVAVTEVRRLTSWLRDQPGRLSPGAVVELVAKADDPETWQPERRPAPAPPVPEPSVDHPVPVATAPAPGPMAATAGPCSCGGTLILRYRRSDWAPFYGCSAFPRCRRTAPVQRPDPGRGQR